MHEDSWTYGNARVVAKIVQPNVILIELSGRFDDIRNGHKLASWFKQHVKPEQRVHLFWDTESMTGYKTQCREYTEEWLNRVRPQLDSNVTLVRSKLMAMAVAVSKLVTGGFIDATADRKVFERKLKSAVDQTKDALKAVG